MRTLRTRRSAVLCYHGVGPSTTRIDPGFLRVEPAAFRAQLDLLLEAGFEFVTVAELSSGRLEGGRLQASSRSASTMGWTITTNTCSRFFGSEGSPRPST
jgi:hypothetical protein